MEYFISLLLFHISFFKYIFFRIITINLVLCRDTGIFRSFFGHFLSILDPNILLLILPPSVASTRRITFYFHYTKIYINIIFRVLFVAFCLFLEFRDDQRVCHWHCHPASPVQRQQLFYFHYTKIYITNLLISFCRILFFLEFRDHSNSLSLTLPPSVDSPRTRIFFYLSYTKIYIKIYSGHFSSLSRFRNDPNSLSLTLPPCVASSRMTTFYLPCTNNIPL